MNRPITEPPQAGRTARFAADFGRRVLLTVDTEEEFDWRGPFTRIEHGLTHVTRIARFQEFCDNLGISPVYLVDWPIVTCREAVDIIGAAVRGGRAEVGIQLHPWVNPPFDEAVGSRTSYAGNLSPALERAKFLKLHARIIDAFGVSPLIYRAGRYGLGPQTADLLREAAVPIDSSVRANFDYRSDHGPDYSAHPLEPYWVDEDHALLELPLTSVFSGVCRRQGPWLHRMLERVPFASGAAARMGLLERIALTPEGVTSREAIRGIDAALSQGLDLLVLSFHSPSLAPGHTPYVRSERDLDRFYDWFRAVYRHFATRDVRPTTIAEIMAAVER